MSNEKRYVVYAEHGNHIEAYYYHTESEARDKMTDLLVTKDPDWQIWMDRMSDKELETQKKIFGSR